MLLDFTEGFLEPLYTLINNINSLNRRDLRCHAENMLFTHVHRKAKRRSRKDEKTKAKRRKDESEKDEKTKTKRRKRKDEKTKAKKTKRRKRKDAK